MQFVGLLLILNSLVGGAWWIATGRPQLVVLPICLAALTAGVFLMIYDRAAESAVKGSGTIKSATQQVAADAAEIARVRERVAEQVAALEQLARENVEAKTLLADLQDQTAVADWHLKQLDEHLNAMRILPDGRTRIGNTVTGQAVVLLPKLETLQKLSSENPAAAYPLAQECVGIYETTREQLAGVVTKDGDLGAETIGWLYAIAATAAQRAGEHDQSLEWARAAVAARPSAERHFLLVTALINKNLNDEANALIKRVLKSGGAETAKFRKFLDDYKIAYK